MKTARIISALIVGTVFFGMFLYGISGRGDKVASPQQTPVQSMP